MTTEELLGQLYDQTLVGNKPAVLELTNAGLAMGLGPEMLLYEALIPSLEEVGARFERGDFFVPEMLIAGKAMAGALEILRPLLAETGAETMGKIVMGTVKGDVHDIGKNLVNIMFEGAGFHVIVSRRSTSGGRSPTSVLRISLATLPSSSAARPALARSPPSPNSFASAPASSSPRCPSQATAAIPSPAAKISSSPPATSIWASRRRSKSWKLSLTASAMSKKPPASKPALPRSAPTSSS